MKDRMARVLAIIALVFMAAFVVMLILTLADRSMLNGAVGYLALGFGVMAFMIFIALKADGRGYSVTKMNNEIEMEKIRKALEEQEKADAAKADEPAATGSDADVNADAKTPAGEAADAVDASDADEKTDEKA